MKKKNLCKILSILVAIFMVIGVISPGVFAVQGTQSFDTTVGSFQELVDAIEGLPFGGWATIGITSGFDFEHPISIGASRGIELVSTNPNHGWGCCHFNGHILRSNGVYRHFSVNVGSLTLGRGVLLSGMGPEVTSGGVQVRSAFFTMNEGSGIQGVSHGLGSAVRLNTSMFYFNGGRITGNYSGAGTIYAYGSNGNVIMNGGEISNNRSSAAGGAITLDFGSTLRMYSGRITYNTSDSSGAIHGHEWWNYDVAVVPDTAFSNLFIGSDAVFYGNVNRQGSSFPPDNRLPHISSETSTSIHDYLLNNYDISYTRPRDQIPPATSWENLRAIVNSVPYGGTATIRVAQSFTAPFEQCPCCHWGFSCSEIGERILIPAGKDITLESDVTAPGAANVRALVQTNKGWNPHFTVEGTLTLGRNIALNGGSAYTSSGGVLVNSGGVFTMTDQSIIESSYLLTGAVYVSGWTGSGNRATFNFEGGIIRNSQRGIAIEGNGFVHMTGGQIVDNDVGVLSYVYTDSNDPRGTAGTIENGLGFKMTGGSIVNNRVGGIQTKDSSHNPMVSEGEYASLYIGENAVFSDNGAIEWGSTSAPPDNYRLLTNIRATTVSVGTHALNNHDIQYEGRINHTRVAPVNTWRDLRAAVSRTPANADITTIIPVSANLLSTTDTANNGGIVVDGGRRVVIVSDDTSSDGSRTLTQTLVVNNIGRRHFAVRSAGYLEIGYNITLNGDNRNSGGIAVEHNGKLVMTDGSIIENIRRTDSGDPSQGSAINVTDGVFTMNGGIIRNNSAQNDGTVRLQGHGQNSIATFNMNGGEIRDNTAAFGGGVRIYAFARMNMSDGLITGNTTTRHGGGGIHVNSGTALSGQGFSMTGGNITNNVAGTNGGGVFAVNSASLNIAGGMNISGNSPQNIFPAP